MANRYPVIVTNTGAGDTAPFAFKEIPSGDDLLLTGNFIRIGSTSAVSDVIKDANGNTVISFPTAVASAVNYFRLNNSATGNSIVLEAVGGDTDVSIHLKPKGSSGEIIVGNGAVAATVKSSGNFNLVLKPGSSNAGTITLNQGSNTDIVLSPHGTGKVKVGANDVVTTGDTGTVTSTMISDGTIVNGDINASAGITAGKLSLTSANIIVGNASNVGAGVSLSGDATISNTGSLTIANSAVTFAKFQNSASAGMSVVGRSTNSAGVFDEIAAATDGHVLRRSGSALGFGLIVAANITDATITTSKLASTSGTGSTVALTGNPTFSGITFADNTNIAISSTTGTRIGTATTDKIGFFNKAPVAQQSAITSLANTATTTTIATAVNSIRAALTALGLTA